ncbi:hypothetical protein O2W18_02090 [Modestobacter sp. VKM Ac-2983]|uniref:hypothetical protein n=1 Tax=Modestobacter sp. VKM Ac-2983 TaxID=3004137 RepID=UPI0022AB7095|nr:hypothetical protein [Modestobacter sp. VKM Ac-2983]MCZ2803888.1 hypothetical protein [Modestobacter sp. VKM Ac-2983]
MAYDPLAESIALIEQGVPEAPPRLSRRRRFVPLAVDVEGDVACTLFARRSVGHVAAETWALARRGQEWAVLGGGGSSLDEEDLTDRPGAAALGGHLIRTGGGSTLRNAGRSMPWGARHVSQAVLRASSAVDRVVVSGREIPVPRHGHLVVVWGGKQPPTAEALTSDGRQLVTLRVDRRTRLPEWYRY